MQYYTDFVTWMLLIRLELFTLNVLFIFVICIDLTIDIVFSDISMLNTNIKTCFYILMFYFKFLT